MKSVNMLELQKSMMEGVCHADLLISNFLNAMPRDRESRSNNPVDPSTGLCALGLVCQWQPELCGRINELNIAKCPQGAFKFDAGTI